MSEPVILGIESSCDDTGVAVLKGNQVLSNVIASQKIHQNYGGVVPELASRAHQSNIVPTLKAALRLANINEKDISAIAYTRGPGLPGSLLVGSSFAKSLALGWGIPLIEVNHMQAHILAHFINTHQHPLPVFPFLCLTVSGGHTQIVLVKDFFDMEIVGETLDDAAGEAFDKIGKIMGLNYPAGPTIDRLAAEGNPQTFTFTQPKTQEFNFSYSGLKTAVLYFLQKQKIEDADFIEKNLNDLCASVQYTIVDMLIKNLEKAAKHYHIQHLAIAGGVSANSELRKRLNALCKKNGYTAYIPPVEYTTDNAAMVAMAGVLKYKQKDFANFTLPTLSRYKF